MYLSDGNAYYSFPHMISFCRLWQSAGDTFTYSHQNIFRQSTLLLLLPFVTMVDSYITSLITEVVMDSM